jgi:hypothetical protein
VKTKKVYLTAALAIGSTLVRVAFAQRPETDINASRHRNLAEAQQHVFQACNKTVAAQQANKDQLGGHAEKAIQLLEQATHELKAAAEFAEHHK